jgi:hypothetical protein
MVKIEGARPHCGAFAFLFELEYRFCTDHAKNFDPQLRPQLKNNIIVHESV